jgi:hypothetical protein
MGKRFEDIDIHTRYGSRFEFNEETNPGFSVLMEKGLFDAINQEIKMASIPFIFIKEEKEECIIQVKRDQKHLTFHPPFNITYDINSKKLIVKELKKHM